MQLSTSMKVYIDLTKNYEMYQYGPKAIMSDSVFSDQIL